jgi:hypothetical protein
MGLEGVASDRVVGFQSIVFKALSCFIRRQGRELLASGTNSLAGLASNSRLTEQGCVQYDTNIAY